MMKRERVPTVVSVPNVDQDNEGIANDKVFDGPSDGGFAVLVVLLDGHYRRVDGWNGFIRVELRCHKALFVKFIRKANATIFFSLNLTPP